MDVSQCVIVGFMVCLSQISVDDGWFLVWREMVLSPVLKLQPRALDTVDKHFNHWAMSLILCHLSFFLCYQIRCFFYFLCIHGVYMHRNTVDFMCNVYILKLYWIYFLSIMDFLHILWVDHAFCKKKWFILSFSILDAFKIFMCDYFCQDFYCYVVRLSGFVLD